VTNPLIDTFDRVHDNLRISVTDRCNIRCFYCMPEDDVKYMPRQEILSFEEIERFARVAVSLGVTKLRITGGEPLVRKDLPVLIRKLVDIPGVKDIALTTNGVLLARHAKALYDAGLRRLNIHLDTLDRERFLRITRRDDLDKVLEGIAEAQRLGFGPMKINAVAVKNLLEQDLVPLARFGRENGIEIRYIEFMPLDAQGIWARNSVLTAGEMIEILSREISPLLEIPDGRPFCLNCNRIRLTSDGKLRYCLFAIEETDMKSLLRNGAPDDEIAATIRAAVREKWIGHEINSSQFVAPPRPMHSIGG
jgi:cyclic pyranopterin phosphate synthase